MMLRQVVEACCSRDHGYLEIAVGIVLVVLRLVLVVLGMLLVLLRVSLVALEMVIVILGGSGGLSMSHLLVHKAALLRGGR